MKGVLRRRRGEGTTQELEVPLDFPPVSEPEASTDPEAIAPETEPVIEPAKEVEPVTENEPQVVVPEPQPLVVTGRPSRITRKPLRFGDYECYPFGTNPGNTVEVAPNQETVTPQDFREEPAASRPDSSSPIGPEEARKGPPDSAVGISQPTAFPDTQRVSQELYRQEWPELVIRGRNNEGPARSRPVKIAPPARQIRLKGQYSPIKNRISPL